MTTRSATDEATAAFRYAQQRVLDRYQVPARLRFVEVPSFAGRSQVLLTGEGPPLPVVIGGAIPAVFWAPLMAELSGYTLYAIELPGNGLPTGCTTTTPGSGARLSPTWPTSVTRSTSVRSVMTWTRVAARGRGDGCPISNDHAPGAAPPGKQDGFGSPRGCTTAVEHMPDADLHVMPGGHAPWLRRAGQVAALTHEFLDTH